ncbi:TPA: hypothetical protein DCF80_00280 [Candidatus Saccharibacteria bacterium]|nr:hypothetical protein [Candidatus Saccharibacteria bacterium]HRK40655.1 NUDIX domain-containing protein [Candidatus Saccharibacteria bacterium]
MQSTKLHFIQKEILRALTMQKWARFRDMRPARVDSNLYNYHLRLLQKNGLVEKVENKGYRLSPEGLRYVDYVSLEQFEPRQQPKLITKLVLVDENGRILMWPKYKQPFIGTWSLPSGKVHFDDESVTAAAHREIAYITNTPVKLTHVGLMEVEARIHGVVITHILEHVFHGAIKAQAVTHELTQWQISGDLDNLECSPGTREAVAFGIDGGPFRYEHVIVDW